MPSSGPLPPSVEKAYYRKCIELRRRITEIEEHNDSARLRIKRLNRAILKMRLERAFLLEQLAQRMDFNVDDSDRSTSPPPTPQDKPLRAKRSHRKTTPTNSQAGPSSQHANSPPPSTGPQASQQPLSTLPMSSAQSTPDPNRSGVFFSGSPTRNVNGADTSDSPTTSRHGGGAQSSLGPPPPQPQFGDAERDEATPRTERRSASAIRENGAGHAREEKEGTEAGSRHANGDTAEGDTEMTDAPEDRGANDA